MKKIITLSIIVSAASSNTMFGMLLRHTQRLALTGQRRYHGGAEINNQQILERLEQQRRLLEIIHDDLKKTHRIIDALRKSQNDDHKEQHLIELPEGKHPLISTIKS